MSKIELKKYGNFLSGRSRAAEIASSVLETSVPSRVVLDFENVDWATQSFISELLVNCHEAGIAFDAFEIQGIENPQLESHIRKEIDRLKMVFLRATG